MSWDLVGSLMPTGDGRPWSPATVLSVDHASARVTVDLDGSAVTLRRVAAAYRPGDVVAVVRGAGAGQFVAGVIGPVAPLWVWAEVTAYDAGTSRLTIDIDGVEYTDVPFIADPPAVFSVTDIVAVLLDPASGMGPLVLGIITNPPADPATPDTPSTPVAATSASVGPVVIRPTWTGTYSTDRGSWDSWGTGAYGGRSDVYQGTDTTGDGGALTGLATFGDQVVNLGATSIESIVVTIRANGAGYQTPVTFTLQGATNGTQPAGAPTAVGVTVDSTAIARNGGVTTVTLDSTICEAMRTGTVKGLVAVGATYAGLFGTSRADALALAVTYTKPI